MQLKRANVTRVGIEGIGGDERGATKFLQKTGFTVIVMQPLPVKALAKLHLQRAKTDRIDAVLIARLHACFRRRQQIATRCAFRCAG